MGTAQQTVVHQEPSYIARMSVKMIGCKPEGLDKPKLLCQIYGRAVRTKSGEDKLRDGRVWTCLSGSFAAVNLETGEEFRSARLFLPDGIQEVIQNAIEEMTNQEVGLHVDFALEIFSVAATNPSGYTYKARNILPTQKRDELSEMQKAITEARAAKQLSAALSAVIEVTSDQTQDSKKKQHA